MKLRQFRLTRIRTRTKQDERGMTTAEYALGTLAACGFAVLLLKLLTGGTVSAALSALLHRALSLAG